MAPRAPSADGEDDHIRRRQHAAIRMDDDAAVCLRKARNRVPQQQLHALLPHMRVEEADHIRVKLSQKLRLLFDNRHAQPQQAQIFRQLDADEASADNYGRAAAGGDGLRADAERILHRAQRIDAGAVDAGQPRHNRPRARREDELVVALGVARAAVERADGDRLCRAVDGGRLLPQPHVDAETGIEALRRLQRQLRFVADGAADVIGQPAVGVGHIPRPLEHDDLRPLVQTAQPRRGRRAARHAADDDDLHLPYHPSPIIGNPADIRHVCIPHPLQQRRSASAAAAAATVDVQRRAPVRQFARRGGGQQLQRQIPAAADVAGSVFLPRADVQQNRIRRAGAGFDAGVDLRLGLRQQTEQRHTTAPQASSAASTSFGL